MTQNEQQLTDVEQLILKALDKWSNAQVNMHSESARVMLAKSIGQEVDPYINRLIEDLVCPPGVGY